ncbi:MAG: cytidine deaminase [Firmicutes bacterium ZCTH02-B6]|nr:MAG: cytidine deaminase [Firmicutes bacterium ZCTH02-B6]
MEMNKLRQAAVEARGNAHVPYSGFAVGAALLDDRGRIHPGCNVENAAYGATNCAERTALFRAVADGAKPGAFRAMAVVAASSRPVPPCGICRQSLAEFAQEDMPVILANAQGERRVLTLRDLFPGAFHLSSPEEG